jgi:hypothetical protein
MDDRRLVDVRKFFGAEPLSARAASELPFATSPQIPHPGGLTARRDEVPRSSMVERVDRDGSPIPRATAANRQHVRPANAETKPIDDKV